MKYTRAKVVMVELTCPYCQESIMDRNTGSFNHDVNDLANTVKCKSCGRESKIPGSIFR